LSGVDAECECSNYELDSDSSDYEEPEKAGGRKRSRSTRLSDEDVAQLCREVFMHLHALVLHFGD
jgi:hypothetical protein